MRIQMLGESRPAFCFTSQNPLDTVDGLSSLTALLEALKNLDDLCVTIDEAYSQSMHQGHYERWDEKS